eukprot:c7222_g1_i1.p1 GENE.c7222_g1_i1~~c7222_g1_i1.p1  ORF type:complete len:459 (-),score=124.57 c7222_g1_i1:54-1430(-)
MLGVVLTALLIGLPENCFDVIPVETKMCICGYIANTGPDVFCTFDSLDADCATECKAIAIRDDRLCAAWTRSRETVQISKSKQDYRTYVSLQCRDHFPSEFLLDPVTNEFGHGERNVHFTWWGNPNPNGDAKQQSLFAAAQQVQRQLVTGSNALRGLKFRFFRDVTAEHLDAFTLEHMIVEGVALGQSGRIFRGTPLEGIGEEFSRVMLSLNHYRALSAMKDLYMLAALYKFGGHYFDTTCSFSDPSSVPPRLQQSDSPKFPCLSNYRNRCAVDPTKPPLSVAVFFSTSRTATGTVIPIEAGESINYPSPRIDMWAAYSPKEHRVMRVAIESYLERAAVFGLNTGGKSGVVIAEKPVKDVWRVPEKLTVDTFMTSATHKTQRESLIAGLVANSVYEALFTDFTEMKENGRIGGDVRWEDMLADEYTWLAVDGGAVRGLQTYQVPDLGLTKTQMNSWRG